MIAETESGWKITCPKCSTEYNLLFPLETYWGQVGYCPNRYEKH